MKKIIILVAIVVVGAGLILFTAKNPSLKLGAQKPATKEQHEDANKVFNEAMKSINQRDFETALKKMDIVIKEDPTNTHAYVVRGGIRRRFMDIQGAYEDYSKALELNPNDNMAKMQKESIEKMPVLKNKDAMQKMKESAERARAKGKLK